MSNKPASLPRPVRLRAALRHAIDLRIVEGKTVVAACYEAGMSPQGYHKAIKRPEVRDYYEEKQADFVASMELDKSVNRARAHEVGIDLLKNAKSEAVKARMVELFLAEKKQPPQITINNTVTSKGYEYVRPGQQVVDVVDAEVVDVIDPKPKLN